MTTTATTARLATVPHPDARSAGSADARLEAVDEDDRVTFTAAANYLAAPGDDQFRALSIDVLRIEDGEIVEVNCFLGADHFSAFVLPGTL